MQKVGKWCKKSRSIRSLSDCPLPTNSSSSHLIYNLHFDSLDGDTIAIIYFTASPSVLQAVSPLFLCLWARLLAEFAATASAAAAADADAACIFDCAPADGEAGCQGGLLEEERGGHRSGRECMRRHEQLLSQIMTSIVAVSPSLKYQPKMQNQKIGKF